MTEQPKKQKASFSFRAWKKIFVNISELKRLVIVLVSMVCALVVLDVFFPFVEAYIIDNFIEKETKTGIAYFAVLYFSMVVVQTLSFLFIFQFSIKLEMFILKILRNRVFNKFQILPVSYFNNRSVGYLVAKTMSDTERIGNTIAWSIIDILWPILYIIGIFIAMLTVNWKIALVIILIVPICLLASIYFEKKLLAKNRVIRKMNSAISGSLNEGITGAKTIKTLNIEQKMTKEFKDQTSGMYKQTIKYNKMLGLYVSLLTFLGSFALAAILTLGGYEFKAFGLSLGDLILFINYTSGLLHPVMQLAESLTNMVANQANVERTLSILEEVPAIMDRPDVIEKYGDSFHPNYNNWEPMDGEIEFRNVSFKYPDDERYILKDFSIKIPKGSSLALVGETGAGKSTIVNLICRFFEPTEGEILIDGVDYRERSQLWLSKNLGYVLQTPHLFSGTIRENIKFANPDLSDEKMIEAAKLVSADKVVEKLSGGYDAEIGECGDSLSTGEKQLITFARAIFADPKVIILDEATSSIDTETEHIIQSAILNVLKDRTSIMIAHRLSTIKNADMILLIDDGQVVEQGTHQSLMQEQNRYYRLYTKMFEEESVQIAFMDQENML